MGLSRRSRSDERQSTERPAGGLEILGDPSALAAPTAPRAPRPRALLLGAAAVIALGFLIPYFNFSLNKYDWAVRPLSVGPVFLLFVLALPVNALLRRLRPSWALTGPELLLVYAMMAICASLASEGLFASVAVMSVHPLYYASAENGWAQSFLPHVPAWLMVNQPEAVRWFFEGLPEGVGLPWRPWLPPLLAWSGFALALYVAFFSLSCLLRKDWIEEQRLAFPMAELPLEMTGEAGSGRRSFFRNPLLWIGVALPAGQLLLQMAHSVWPAVPYAPLYFNLGTSYFAGRGPWDALKYVHVYVGFETIGLLALLPKDVLLSLWLFYVASRAELFAFAAGGYGMDGQGAGQFSPYTFVMSQEAGGALVLAALILWQSRRAIIAAFRAVAGRPTPYDPLDPVSPRVAAVLLVLSLGALCLWAVSAGMDLWVFIALLAVFLGFSLVIARLVAAAGVFVPLMGLAPRDMLVGLSGAAPFSTGSLTMMTYLQAIFMNESTWKVSLLHFSLNDMKLAHAARIPGRLLTWALLLAVVLMLIVAPWGLLRVVYSQGGHAFSPDLFGPDTGGWGFGQLTATLRSPERATPFLLSGLLVGGVVMLALNWLHMNYLWWGLSPVGFVMSNTWGMNRRLWTNAFIAWVIVTLLGRVGGLRLYRKARPMFLGMILGHFLMIGLRTVLDPLLGIPGNLAGW